MIFNVILFTNQYFQCNPTQLKGLQRLKDNYRVIQWNLITLYDFGRINRKKLLQLKDAAVSLRKQSFEQTLFFEDFSK